jgi:protoporphyrinogen oxidase
MPVRVAILGAGPAGVGAAWQLVRQHKASVVLVEQRAEVGGNAASFELEGLPVDYGSHRLHPACRPEILNDLRSLLGADLLDRPRHGRIRLRGRWIRFPLRPLDLVAHLPRSFALGVTLDGVRKVITRAGSSQEETFASLLERNLGTTICRDFYFPYGRKIWGVPPQELSPVQAARRVSATSAGQMTRKVLGLVPGLRAPGAGRFYYPRQGFGQISRALADAARDRGAVVHLGTSVRSLHLGGALPHRIQAEGNGALRSIEADYVWSTIPLTTLVQITTPAAPATVIEACRRVEYRAMVLVYLVLAQPQFTRFDAHYFPEEDVPLTRVSEPKNYSGCSEPTNRTVLCAELPCAVGDAVWRQSDEELAGLTRQALARCGLSIHAAVLRAATKRLPYAYPIYRRGYEEYFQRLDDWVGGIPRVLTFGRQGLFAHDNTHHALAMAYAAADCLDAAGAFDAARWRSYRGEFEQHVVED